MRIKPKPTNWIKASVLLVCCTSCQSTSFAGRAASGAHDKPVVNAGGTSSVANTSGTTPSGTPASTPPPTMTPGQSCSANYSVPGTANPWLAGVADGTKITYQVKDKSNPVDTAPDQSPVLVQPTDPNCFAAGVVLSFTVSGQIAYGNIPSTDANGSLNEVDPHQKGAILGKANMTGPLNSLVGVFLSDADPTSAQPPADLDFSSQAARDYGTLSPQIGQVFYVGTGVSSSGAPRQVVVPQGAKRFYFGIMDAYQWNNNKGTLTGAIVVGKP